MACKTNRLRELRELRGLKRHELAVEFGVDPSTIYRWETGAELGDEDMKAKVAEFFGVSREHLMGWDRESPEPLAGKAGTA